MSKVRIGVMVSGGGTNLQALIDAEKEGKIPDGTIVLTLSDNEKAYALTRAANAGIKTYVVSRKQYDRKEFEKKATEILEDNGIELIVLAGFMRILGKEFIKKYENRIINVHPSLIPSFCGEGYYGIKVHEAALGYGVKVSGATVHYVNEIPDGGKIIKQKAVEVKEGDTPETLQKRIMEQAEWIILPEAAEKVCREIKKEILDTIYELKTGALIEASMMIGALLGGGSAEEVGVVERIARHVGIAFQIQDDILDVTSTNEVLGKPVHSDEKNGKTTYVTLMGVEEAGRIVEEYSQEAIRLLKTLPGENEYLEMLLQYLIRRDR